MIFCAIAIFVNDKRDQLRLFYVIDAALLPVFFEVVVYCAGMMFCEC